MSALGNAIRQHALMADGLRADVRLGTVSSYNPDDHAVKVVLQPDGDETGWLPIAAMAVGQGWGMIFAPSIGDQVDVHFQEGDAESGFVCCRFFNDQDRPMSVPSGEFWLVHKSGSYIKVTNDGKILVNGMAEIDLTAPTLMIQATGNVNVQAGGQANITAPSINMGDAGASLVAALTAAFATLYNGHTHHVNGTNAESNAPTQLAGPVHMTSNVKVS